MLSLLLGFVVGFIVALAIRSALKYFAVSGEWIASPDGSFWVIGVGKVCRMPDGTFSASMTDGQDAGDWTTLRLAQKSVEQIARSYRKSGGYAAHYARFVSENGQREITR